MNVYLITFDDEHYKIGCSVKDADERLSSLQTGNPFKLRLLRSVDTGWQRKKASIEKLVHSDFREFRCVGEWFKLGKEGPSLFDAAIKKYTGVSPTVPLSTLAIELTPEGQHFKELIDAQLQREQMRGTLPGFGLIYFSRRIKKKWMSFDVDLLDSNFRLTDEAAKRGVQWKFDYMKEASLRGFKRPQHLCFGGGATNHTEVLVPDRDRAITMVASLLSNPLNLRPNKYP